MCRSAWSGCGGRVVRTAFNRMSARERGRQPARSPCYASKHTGRCRAGGRLPSGCTREGRGCDGGSSEGGEVEKARRVAPLLSATKLLQSNGQPSLELPVGTTPRAGASRQDRHWKPRSASIQTTRHHHRGYTAARQTNHSSSAATAWRTWVDVGDVDRRVSYVFAFDIADGYTKRTHLCPAAV